MKDQTQDAECQARNKVSSAKEHLEHLRRIGHKNNSMVIKEFIEKNRVELMNEGALD